jgi:hypothetical protein
VHGSVACMAEMAPLDAVIATDVLLLLA